MEIVESIVQPLVDFSKTSEADRIKLNKDVSNLKGRMNVVEEKVGINTIIKYKEEY